MVLLVRAAASPDPLPGEEGVLCGARRRTPVVVAGAITGHPYADLATADDETDDVVTTVETVRALPLVDYTVAANVAFHACLAVHGLDPARGQARVYRRNGGLAVQLHVDGERPEAGVVTAASVRVLQALRLLDPWASGVDVSSSGPRGRGLGSVPGGRSSSEEAATGPGTAATGPVLDHGPKDR
jgi:hypothetical protein